MFVEVASAALQVYDQRQKLRGAFAAIAFLLSEGFVKVLVLGAGGTGKSTLARRLSDGPAIGGAYNVSPVPEHSKLDDIPFGKVTVFPGQPRRRELYMAEINERLQKGARVLIHNVAYGYHSIDTDSMRDHRLYEPGDDAQTFMARLHAHSLNEEIKVLDEVSPLLASAPRDSVLRLVTLVSKQDLWWSQREAAKKYYGDPTGEYGTRIAKLTQSRGQHFEHSLFSLSSEQLNLQTNAGELLATTSAGYDDRLQAANAEAFARHFHALCGAKVQ